MQFTVYDEDGILAVVNGHRYKTFVHEDWELDQLLAHFAAEMNNGNMAVWQTNNDGGGDWDIEVLDKPSDKPAHREFTKTMEVTDGALYISTYTDLTMAAQFAKYKVPAEENAHLRIPLENGPYRITVRQLFNPEESYGVEDGISFEIITTKTASPGADKVDGAFWWTM